MFIEFLNPLFLIATAAAAVPIVIHLMFKRRTRSVEFPDLRFLNEIEKRISRRKKLEELLLLALRCLFLLLIVLGLSHPIIRESGTGSASDVVIVLDDSVSMNIRDTETTRFERAKAYTLSILERLRQGDRAAVVTMNSGTIGSGNRTTTDIARVISKTKELKCSSGGGDMSKAFAASLELLKKSELSGRELYVLSDLQKYGWAGLVSSTKIKPAEISFLSLYLVQFDRTNPANTSVDDIAMLSVNAQEAVPAKFRARVTNFSGKQEDRSVKWFLDDTMAGQRLVTIPAGSSVPVLFEVTPQSKGWHGVTVSISDDPLPDDNRVYSAFNCGESRTVLIIDSTEGGYAGSSFYAEKAINSIGFGQSVKFETASPDSIAEIPAEYQTIFVFAAGQSPEKLAAMLANFAAEGRVVYLFVSPESEEGMAALVKAAIGGEVTINGTAGNLTEPSTYVSIKDVQSNHPVFKVILDTRNAPDISRAKFFTVPVAECSKNCSVLARYDGGIPAVVEAKTVPGANKNRGTALLCMFSLSPRYSNFVFRVSFIPFMFGLLKYSSAKAESESYCYACTTKLLKGSGLVVTDAEDNQVRTEKTDAGFIASFDKPGIYRVSGEGEEGAASMIPVNVDPSESDTQSVSRDVVNKFLTGTQVKWFDESKSLQEQVEQARFGTDVSFALFFLALLAFLGECILANYLFGLRQS